jgi:hypothetical protein
LAKVGFGVPLKDRFETALPHKHADGLLDVPGSLSAKFSRDLGFGARDRAEGEDGGEQLVLVRWKSFSGKYDGHSGISFEILTGSPVQVVNGILKKDPELPLDFSTHSGRAIAMDDAQRGLAAAANMTVVKLDEKPDGLIHSAIVQVEFKHRRR